MRHAADVIRVGAAAVRIENYSGAVIRRAAAGPAGAAEAEVPPIAVVTQTGDLDPSALLFTRTEVPPPILTCSQSFADTSRRLGAVAEVIDASGPEPDTVDGATVLKILAERKLFRVLTGWAAVPELADRERLARRAVPDGGAHPGRRRGAANRHRTPAQVHTKMRRTHLLTDGEGYLYTRYVKAD